MMDGALYFLIGNVTQMRYLHDLLHIMFVTNSAKHTISTDDYIMNADRNEQYLLCLQLVSFICLIHGLER